ncbi:hypothetical protein F6V25_14205 [Oryzomonas japonica]|uniref:Uncharacterized protein n=1 Tax=Oryzomonas japonica TaxID=2603858 RepID=A0A7J4ZNQ0_9BACT|nr:hypothetical protein [Oryzomonas japonica]KAB0663964.1 hypothetical protein F6V25_14205 [Oryzomonas japonica]
MSGGWLALLKNVPWSEVISNAPKVVDGAKKLWNTVAKRPSPPEISDSNVQSATSPGPQAIALIEARTLALEDAVANLQGQMRESSELIKALADQNAQLIQRIESNRVRTLWLSATTAVVAMVAVLGLLLTFSRHGA